MFVFKFFSCLYFLPPFLLLWPVVLCTIAKINNWGINKIFIRYKLLTYYNILFTLKKRSLFGFICLFVFILQLQAAVRAVGVGLRYAGSRRFIAIWIFRK